MQIHNCILLSGTMRSGTTLMATVLNSHSEIALAVDVLAWYWKYCYGQFGDLSDILMLDKCLYEIAPISNWHQIYYYDPVRVKERVLDMGISYRSLHQAFLSEVILINKDLKFLGEKSTHSAEWYADFLYEYPEGHIVHMIRDPRDVIASLRVKVGKDKSLNPRVSWRQRIVAIFSKKFLQPVVTRFVQSVGWPVYRRRAFFQAYPERIVGYWKKAALFALRLQEKSPNHVHIVRYEDLVTQPRKTIGELLAQMGLDFENNILAYEGYRNRSGQQWEANTSYQNMRVKGFSTAHIGQYKRVLSPAKSHGILSQIGDIAAHFGYDEIA